MESVLYRNSLAIIKVIFIIAGHDYI
ncbi:hypothetical protein A2U01_0095773, partial [Trifolium medium]|nr:hypothetical protein [Trifolium medium]